MRHLSLFIIAFFAISIGNVSPKKKGKDRTIILGGGGGGPPSGGGSHIVPIPIPYPIPVPMGQHHHAPPQIQHIPQSQPQIILVPTYQHSYHHPVDHWSGHGQGYDSWGGGVQYLGHIGGNGHLQGNMFGKRK
ncbi:uncharacterized protein LOC107372208 isoform X2 [Tetranychus urticae]|uniref:uncharacterized protein LOC107372208 isoform X2 n=1 Tax=Tetranychus urticae TaxID=32264 RepID=UPI00077BDF7E|nr:uncharacterized protein LOC107372208 isoform X2 [Tetranychus urticae]